MAARRDEDVPLILELHNPYPHAALFDLVVHWGSLPDDTTFYLAFGQTASPLSKKAMERAGVKLGDRKARAFFEALPEERCGERVRFDLDQVYHVSPDKQRRTTLPDIPIRPARPAMAALRVVLPKKPEGAPPQFDVVQVGGTRVVGGCTFVVKQV
jgi:hypothetical protein